MKLVRSLCTLAVSAASVSAFVVGPAARRCGANHVVVQPFSSLMHNTPASSSGARGVVRPLFSRSSVSTNSQLQMASPSDFIQTAITNNKVVVFSKSYCPFCTKTKDLFSELGVDATVYELNQMDNGADIQDTLLELTGQRTVPNTFINGQHVGGNDNVQSANKSGKLKELLAAKST